MRRWLTAHDVGIYPSILITGLVAYGLFFVPAVFMDDWTSVLERIVSGRATWLDLEFRNPLLFTPFLLQYRLFSLNLTAYYAIIWSLYAVSALLLYFIVIQFRFPDRRLFGLLVAILYLVYPTNYTHMWLIQLGIYCALLLTLAYAYCLLGFARGGRRSTLAIALSCLLLSLGFYEGQIGIAAVWPFLVASLHRPSTARRLVGLFSPLVLIGLFSLWRTVGFQAAGIGDQYLSRVVLTPDVLLSRLVLGYKVSLIWGWTYSIQQLLPGVSSTLAAATLLSFAIAIAWLISRATGTNACEGIRRTHVGGLWSAKRLKTIRPFIYSAVMGLALVGAGYVPVLTVYLPSLSGIGSRHNMFATIGSAIVLGSTLMAGVLFTAKDLRRVRQQLPVCAAPFLLVAITTQASVQYHNRVAWVEQQDIWRQLFSAAPDIKDDTMVLLVLPGFEDRTGYYNWRRTPLSASWEVSSALRLLYGNYTLSGDVYFPDIEEPTEPVLARDGIRVWDADAPVPYSRVAAFLYDRTAGRLVRLDAIPPEWTRDAAAPLTVCHDCIRGELKRSVPLRALVLSR